MNGFFFLVSRHGCDVIQFGLLYCVTPQGVAVCIVGSEKWGLLGDASVVVAS